MDVPSIPALTSSPDFDRWLDEHLEAMLNRVAAFFPLSLRRCPLVSDALDGALEPIKADPRQFAALDRLLQEHAHEQLTRMMNSITGMAVNMVRSYPDLARVVDDVPNQVYLRLCDMSPRSWFDPTRSGAFWGWLRGVTYHVARKMLDREQRALGHASLDLGVPVASSAPPPDAGLLQESPPPIHELVRQMLAALSDPLDRRIFSLRFVENRAVEEIAGDVAMTAVAVYQRIHRLREKLREGGFGGLRGD
jgi:RNA polymerase sigma factor (sigma-70 family)